MQANYDPEHPENGTNNTGVVDGSNDSNLVANEVPGRPENNATAGSDFGEPVIDQPANEEVTNTDPLAVSATELHIKAERVPLYEIHNGNNDEIDILLNEPDVIDDDLEIVSMPENGVPKPFAATTDNLFKRENDLLSGQIPYNNDVSINKFLLVFSPY